MNPSILIVEDDAHIAQLIQMTLQVSGYRTEICPDGIAARARLSDQTYDLIILDVMLPGLDGFSLMEALQQAGRSLPPVLFLTAKLDVADRVRGLRLGAEDYMLKPFHPVELQARVEGILRRHQVETTVYQAYDVCLNLGTRQVTKAGRPVELAHQEFELLAMLMRHQNMALSREQLLSAAWGYDYAGSTRTVDMHIQRLRSKLDWGEQIKTVYKLGYRLEVPA